MASKVLLKKSSVATKAPVAGDLDYGELAINYTDGKLYFKKADNTIDYFVTGAAAAPVLSVGGFTGDVTAANLMTAIQTVDGIGSGLDADTVDGLQASAFYLASNPNGYTSNTGTVTSVGATAPVVSSGGTAPTISMAAATSTVNGYMTSTYAAKLDGIAAGAQVNVATNLAQGTRTTTTVPITSSTGTSATLDIATTLLAGVMSSADKTKLDGIATGAQVNVATNLAQGTRTTTTVPITSSTGTSATLDIATTLLAGMMSSADKTKLDGIATGATANTGTVTSVGGTGTVSGLTLSGTVTSSGNLTLGGTLSLTSANVTTALGFTPYNSTNPSGYITSSSSITGTSYGILSPNGSTVVSGDASTAMPSTANSFTHTLGTGPSANDGHILGMTWTGVSSYGAQIWLDTDPTNRMAIRSRSSTGVWNGWSEVLTALNYNSYSPTLTGGGASGTWSINITGSAGSASTATTATNLSGGTINGLTLNQYNTNNARLYSTAAGTMGLLGVDSNGTYRWQIYGDGSNYGFLDSAWGAWDINKTVNGDMTLRVATVNRTVIHSGNIGSQSVSYASTAGNGGVTSVNGSTGAVTISGGQYLGTAATKAIAYNSNTISENITIAAGQNGLSAGPITISTGNTVTVATGAVWVIV